MQENQDLSEFYKEELAKKDKAIFQRDKLVNILKNQRTDLLDQVTSLQLAMGEISEQKMMLDAENRHLRDHLEKSPWAKSPTVGVNQFSSAVN